MDIEHLMKKYMWAIIFVAIIISFIYPNPGLMLKPYLIYLLMLLMFFSCLGINLKKIAEELKDCRDELATLAIIHLASPILILFLKPFLPEEVFLGLILAAVISSGMSVVFLSYLYGGIASEALVITSISNILSPITVPFLVLLFARTTIRVDVLAMIWTIFKLVAIPLAAAALIRKTSLNKPLEKHGSYISIVVLFVLILGIISPVRDVVLSNLNLSLILGAVVSVLVTINFFLGYLIGKSKPEKITYAITASYKNMTLSTVIALSLFNPMVALPSVIYAVVNNLFLIPLQLIFVRKK